MSTGHSQANSNSNTTGEKLAIRTIFQDEARYLAEWIEFHRLQGLGTFITTTAVTMIPPGRCVRGSAHALPYLKSYKRKRAELIVADYLEVKPRNGKYSVT